MMINAEELRIGNLVNFRSGMNLFHHIDYDDFKFDSFVDYEPIPLTPEILKKCEYDKKVFWVKEYMHTDGYDMAINGNWLGVQLKHLHQLQNLYFTLTGEELNIQL